MTCVKAISDYSDFGLVPKAAAQTSISDLRASIARFAGIFLIVANGRF